MKVKHVMMGTATAVLILGFESQWNRNCTQASQSIKQMFFRLTQEYSEKLSPF